jgi:DNA polymerase-3 subunit delta'
VHAYLLVGPRGSGVERAARDFAVLLLGIDEDERGRRLVERGVHPDVVEFEPAGASYRVKDDVRERILPEAARAPIEADRKVLILFEAERLRGNQNESANAMLKPLEEPPDRTVVILVTSAPDDLLATIRSRCQRIDFDSVADDAIAAALEREGLPADTAAGAAALSGGQLARARELAGPLSEVRAAFAAAPARVDGRGGTATARARRSRRETPSRRASGGAASSSGCRAAVTAACARPCPIRSIATPAPPDRVDS